jgi:hypothetical protein
MRSVSYAAARSDRNPSEHASRWIRAARTMIGLKIALMAALIAALLVAVRRTEIRR